MYVCQNYNIRKYIVDSANICSTSTLQIENGMTNMDEAISK